MSSGRQRLGHGDMKKPATGNTKVQQKPAGGERRKMPSDKLNPKTVNPFAHKSSQSSFESVYTKGGIPCRLMHGSVKHKLQWDIPCEKVPYDPVLITLAEGLRETRHPYTFVSIEGFKELLQSPGAAEKVVPIVNKVAPSIRAALTSGDAGAFERGLAAISCLSDCIGPELDVVLKILMTCLARRMASDRKRRDDITAVLQKLETNGGDKVLSTIKSKVPAYCSVFC